MQRIRTALLICLDIILINLSLRISYFLRLDGSNIADAENFYRDMVHIAIVCTFIKIAVFLVLRLYKSLWKYASIYEMISLLNACFIGNVLMLSYAFLMQVQVPRGIFIINFFTDLFLIGGVRFAYRIFMRLVMGEIVRGKDFKRVLVLGGGDAGAIIIKELKNHTELKSIPVAIVDDDAQKKGKKINGVPICGSTKDIQQIIVNRKVDEIIIAMPSASHSKISEIYDQCSKSTCKIKILPSMSQLIDESVAIQKIRDVNIEDLLGRDPVKLDMEEIEAFIKGKVVLVTGGGGSIGSELCRQVAEYSPKLLVILDNYENNAYDIQNELLYKNPELNLVTVIANIREKPRLEDIFKRYRPSVVFHAAAHKHVPLMEANPAEAIKNNVFGTLNVAECADKFEAKKFVLISTDKAVNPTNIMGATKRIAEMIIQGMDRHSKTEFAAVRFGNVLGSNGSVIPLFKKQIEQGGPVTVTHPEIIRYFMTIPEAVQLVLQAGAMAKGGEIFVLDMGEPVKIYDLARNLIKLSGFEPDVDIKIEFSGLRPGEKLYEELLMAEEGLKATKNNKIHIAKPINTDLELLKRQLSNLKDIIWDDAEGIMDYVECIVPTYKKAQ